MNTLQHDIERRTLVSDREVWVPSAMRAQHHALLLRLLWEHREISRADLARMTGLSRSTVSAIVSNILNSGLVRETRAGSSRGGRRPILLEFNENARTIVGLDVGATHIAAVAINLRGRVLEFRRVAHQTRTTEPSETLAAAEGLCRELMVAVDGRPVLGVGVGVPAPLHPVTNRPLATVLPAWVDFDFAKALAKRLDTPVRLENDANAGALAELYWGAGRSGDDLVYVKVATGIGAGLIFRGQIIRGSQGIAGELGHLSLDPNGPPCICGVSGCLNVLIGTPALLARAAARRPHFPDSRLPREGITLQQLLDAVQHGDPLALEIIEFAGDRLGDGLANLLNILDPSIVVLGGELASVGEPLLQIVRRKVRRRTLVTGASEARIVMTSMDREGVAVGAATLIFRAVLETQEIPLGTEMEAAT